MVDDAKTHYIETQHGKLTLRNRSGIWHIRAQRNLKRFESSLKTRDLNVAVKLAIDRADFEFLGMEEIPNKGAPGDKFYSTLFDRTKRRAESSGTEFSLIRDDLDALVKRAGGICELTGVPLQLGKMISGYRAPYAPSIDRISSAGGYTIDNVRLVCVAANWALSDWGQTVFDKLARGYVARLLSK